MTVIGYVDGAPVPVRLLDVRLAELRAARPHALPVPESPEGRQFRRWTAQVLLTEALCAGSDLSLASLAPVLDQAGAVDFGSITAAAYERSPAVRAAFVARTAGVTVPESEVDRYWAATAQDTPEQWTLRHRLNGGPWGTLGPARLAELPQAVAEEVQSGRGTARDALGLHEFTVTAHRPAEPADATAHRPAIRDRLLAAARRQAFALWLDQARASRLVLVPGCEHPGDPGQPDNHHRH
ncbi:DUF7158 domain-containing protein [Longispora albida]|uniref:DUF7158 domain-containing protein n=1 Tax=Longispora albida TaxID=203523 RepID=UPI00037F53A9|nr:hypothetical protein [Longispora albida]